MNWARDLREMGSEGAPGHVETRLRAAFRERHARRRWYWLPIAVAATVMVAAGLSFWVIRPADQLAPPPVLAARALTPDLALRKTPIPVRQSAIRNLKSAMVQEVATDFFPMPYASDGRGLESGTLVRVGLPRAAMTSFGFPVDVERRQERIQADVLLGEDGRARAVRFVQPRPGVSW